jgi:CubicO group peptidase (beta-lactamase class C family)
MSKAQRRKGAKTQRRKGAMKPLAIMGFVSLLLVAGAPLASQANTLEPALAARVDSVYSRFTAPESPGCALGVVRNGRLDYARGYGLASIEHGVPITPATVFDIGSVSKQFTAMAVVLLAQDGKLSLDDEIQKFLPEIPRYKAGAITIRHLLHHTSGLRDYIDVLGWSGIADEAVTTDADALLAISKQRGTNFAPGSEFLYSNSGYFLLSVIVRRVSGHTLRDFAATRIFAPLEMTHTQIVDRHELIVPGKAGSYAPGPGGSFVLSLANWEQTGDGAVNTTVEDLVKWERNFETGAVSGAAGIAELHKTGVAGGKPITYALGLGIDSLRGVRRVSHGGAWAGYRAHIARFPDQKLSLISLCNLSNSNPGQLNERVAVLLLEGQLGPATAPGTFVRSPMARTFSPTAAALSGIAGTYRSSELLADWVISLRRDSVLARAGLGAEYPLRPVAADTFAAFGTRVVFSRTGGTVTGLILDNRGLRDFRLTKVEGR